MNWPNADGDNYRDDPLADLECEVCHHAAHRGDGCDHIDWRGGKPESRCICYHETEVYDGN